MALRSSFAHLLGLSAARAKDDEDEDKKKAPASRKAEDDDKKDDEDDKKKDARAEDEKKDGDDEDDDKKKDARADGDDDDQDASEDDEDEDDKKDKGKDAKAARARERARCAAIFGCKAAGARPDLAAHLAFNTDLGRHAAAGMLQAAVAGEPKPKGMAARMTGFEQLQPGQDRAATPTTRQTVAASWDAAAQRAGVSKPKAK